MKRAKPEMDPFETEPSFIIEAEPSFIAKMVEKGELVQILDQPAATVSWQLSAHESGQLIGLMKDLLLAIRSRAVAGYKPWRCLACNVPHLEGRCRGDCVHHKALKFLKDLGVDGLENMQ